MKEAIILNFDKDQCVEELYSFISKKVKICPPKNKIKYVVACDVHYSEYAFSSCVLYDLDDVVMIEESNSKTIIKSEYKSGFFSLREAPPIIEGLKRIYFEPDCIIINGHGISHPLKAGLACFIGVAFEKPTFGIAKKPLVGEYRIPKDEKGAWEPIYYENTKVGEVIKTRAGSKPVFGSPGHLIDFTTMREVALKLVKNQRLPEPLYLAHKESKELSKNNKKGG